MAVTMVIGNRAQIKASLFEPAYTMASVIANEFAEASGMLHVSALIEIGLLLNFGKKPEFKRKYFTNDRKKLLTNP